ncbi:MAG: response regulator, partial [Solirubrobacterales bacterium]
MIEVLFIDDHVNEIEPVARTLQLRTGLKAACTDKVDEALHFVRTEHVKVAVLDQRMEERLDLTGTELYDKIRAIDKRVRGIIFSGE